MPRKRACRYGKNGYFGICGCGCDPVVITDSERVKRLRELVTTDHETKDAFIARVNAILNN